MSDAEMPLEEWRAFDEHYEVSNMGRVRTVYGRVLGQSNLKAKGCYPTVRLSSPRRSVMVHRMVAKVFCPNPNGLPVVNHIDCVRSNNRATNLEWCTQLQNVQHSDRLGRMQRDYWKGRRSPSAALTDDEVRQMRLIYASGTHSWAAIGKMFGISKRSVGRAINLETYADVQ